MKKSALFLVFLLLVALKAPTAISAAIMPALAADGSFGPAKSLLTVNAGLGDANNDGYVNIADVTTLMDYLLDGDDSQIDLTNSDVDQNGRVEIADVTEMVDYLLTGYWSWEESQPQTETFWVDEVMFTMVTVEGGTFTMGATPEQEGDAMDDEYPPHEVTLSSFSIGETEVTIGLWEAVMGPIPPLQIRSNEDDEMNRFRAMDGVSWDQCQEFITKLNQLTGKNFRLPTEAEWEFAARGGNMSRGYKYAGSDNLDEVGWYVGNYYYLGEDYTCDGSQNVAFLSPNELGLYDMSGNVWEWCQDWYDDGYSSDPQTNPTGPTYSPYGSYRVCRGGAWDNEAERCRVSSRERRESSSMACGFRLAL